MQILVTGNQHNLIIRIHGKSVVAFCGTLQLVNLKQNSWCVISILLLMFTIDCYAMPSLLSHLCFLYKRKGVEKKTKDLALRFQYKYSMCVGGHML